MLQITLFSAAAGILGTGFGGLASTILFKRPTENMACWVLSFAAGVMTSVVCFGLVPEAMAMSGVLVSVSGLIAGIVIIMALNRLVDAVTEAKGDSLKVHSTHEELYHEGQMIGGSAKMLRAGVLMFTAIGLHNIPEGLAIGAGGSHDFQLGALLAAVIALHNIPEGMAVAAPMLAGGLRKGKVILLTALSGAPTLLGGLIGVLTGRLSDLAVALSLSAAGGAMLYVVFGEIIPQSIVMTRNRAATIVTLFGIIVGLIVTRI